MGSNPIQEEEALRIHTEEEPCEDTTRRQQSISRKERPQEKPNLPAA